MAKKKPTPTLRQSLEKALVANPADLAAHSAFADHLSEQGDPRGEFVQVQLALEDAGRSAAERKRLQKREAELWRAHGTGWLGALAPHLLPEQFTGSYAPADYRMARGWLDYLRIPVLTTPLLNALVAAPEAALLRTLVISGVEDFRYRMDESGEPFPELEALTKAKHLRNVRVFRIGGEYPVGDRDFRYNMGPEYHPGVLDVVRSFPRLEELYLDCDFFGANLLAALPLKHLRVLQLCFLSEYPLAELAANESLGRLQTLLIHPAGLNRDRRRSAIPLTDVKALVRSPHLTALSMLRLHMTEIGDRGCDEIVRSGVLRRLKVLDLAFGCMTDVGAARLATCADFRHLEVCDVHRNALTDKGLHALRETGVKILGDDEQHDVDDREYLYEGEYE